jgi:thiol-disulfide isomerase/thioredoxin
MQRLIYLFVFVSFGFLTIPGNKKDFIVEFTPPKDITISKYYLDKVIDGKLNRDSSTLMDGKVIFKGSIEQPMKARILLFLTANAGERPEVKFVDVLLEPAQITIDASRGLEEAIYSGSKNQQQFTAYKASLTPLYKSINDKWMEINNAVKTGDKNKETKLREEARRLSDQAMSVKEAFLEKETTSLVTALMLKDYVGPVWENLEKAEKYYSNLSPELKALPDMISFAKGLSIATTMAVGKMYPDFSLPDSNGKRISISSLKGKYVFVDFWASWCYPCRAESPALVAAYNKYNNKGFEILSISFDEKKDAWLKAVTKDGYTWTNVVDTTGMGPKGTVSSKLEINAIPRNFLLDKEGKVLATNLRGEALEEKLKELFGS